MPTTATRQAASASTRATNGARAGGRLTVGDYVGLTASQAAQAVRRAGLRAALERSFGCAPELMGQVVAQEPTAGSVLQRNRIVVLHIAAPAMAEPDARIHEPVGETPVSQRLALGDPPAPDVTDEPHESALYERDGLSTETDELVVHADDIFAGRRGELPVWRRYPRRRLTTVVCAVRVRLAKRPRFVAVVGALLALWAAVAISSTTSGGRASHPPVAVRADDHGTTRATAMAPAGAIAQAARMPRAGAHESERRRPSTRRRPTPAHDRVARGHPRPYSSVLAPTAQPSPAPQQTQGGPFSP
jgi:hypothetical protein